MRNKAVLCVMALTRLAVFSQAGTLDPTFDGNGLLITSMFESYGLSDCWAVSVQPDGRILAAGQAQTDFAVARYLENGALDPSFSGDGKAYVSFSANTDHAHDMEIQQDGKILLAGFKDNYHSLAIARLMPDGTLDNTYGDYGTVALLDSGGSMLYSIALQEDGKAVACGTSPATNGAVVLRLTTTGALDSTFGTNGMITGDLLPDILHDAECVRITPDGGVMVGGRTGAGSPFLLLFDQQGMLDSSFGSNGALVLPEDRMSTYQMLPDGGVLTAGWDPAVTGSGLSCRFLPTGVRDSTYGVNGRVSLQSAYNSVSWEAVTVQADGRIILIGSAGFPQSYSRFTTARLETDGSLDASYGVAGWTYQDIGGGGAMDFATDGCLQPDGKLVVGGLAETTNGSMLTNWFGLMRYSTDGSVALDGTRGSNTTALTVQPSVIENDRFDLVFRSSTPERWTIRLFDETGHHMRDLATDREVAPGLEHMAVHLPDLSAGVYLITGSTRSLVVITRFIKL